MVKLSDLKLRVLLAYCCHLAWAKYVQKQLIIRLRTAQMGGTVSTYILALNRLKL